MSVVVNCKIPEYVGEVGSHGAVNVLVDSGSLFLLPGLVGVS